MFDFLFSLLHDIFWLIEGSRPAGRQRLILRKEKREKKMEEESI